MTEVTEKIPRSPKTWFTYLILAIYGYCLNVAGPVVTYLKTELNLSYTASSVHTSAFALGIVLVGLFGGALLSKLNYWQSIGLGALGLGIGSLLVTQGHTPMLTITGLFVMGLVGTLILATYPAVLDEEMGKYALIGISEANTLSSVFASVAPLILGFFAGTALTWRPGLLIVTSLAFLIGLWLLISSRGSKPQELPQTESPVSGKLSRRFWLLWSALVVAVSIEFCTIYWSGNYIQQVLFIPQAQATQIVSSFLLGMVVGRFLGSRLMLRIRSRTLLIAALLLAASGFAIFWSAASTLAIIIGLALMGLGVANLYPVILALAMGSAGDLKALAGSRSTLASGTAILLLPFALGSTADQVGIRAAFLVVAVLIVVLTGLLLYISRRKEDD